MECNKDEAIRAKKIAESKMTNNDFEGARKIALKAKKLFPELDNISQLLTVCDVHCSAQKTIYGGEMDLYGILQVERSADEATIRKQYRKLAFVLHPDKNKFPGAEAAFKLIGQANMILSDAGKRCIHDRKYREPAIPTTSRSQNNQGNQNSHVGAQSKYHSVPSGINRNQQTQSDSNSRARFWTSCPSCFVKYEYFRDVVNKSIRCPNCSKYFTAFDLGFQWSAKPPHYGHAGMQSVNLGSSAGQPVFSQQEAARRQENAKVNAQKTGQPPPRFSHEFCSSTEVPSTRYTRTEDAKIGGSSRTRTEEKDNINTEVPKADAEKARKTRISKDRNRKKGRKMVESSDSDVECASKGRSRKRPQVSCSEEAGDDFSFGKKQRLRKLYSDVEDTQEQVPAAAEVKDVNEPKASARAEGSMPKDKIEEKHNSKGEDVIPNGNSKSDLDSEEISEPVVSQCPDPEFSNFEKDKEKACFAVDQVWACYDTVDGMPRFYAQVRRVYSSGFRLRITWLEADPENHLEMIWVNEGLPVACGKFVRGSTEETRDILMFSHQVAFEKGSAKFSYVIHPKKGEIWALFKDWDIKWSSDPKNHMKYKFDIVEVLSDFDTDNGVLVAYMIKVEGFVSLFSARCAEVRIPSSELFRFSHRIPSVKLTGTERAGVPVGSFELDTASLPDDLHEYCLSNKVEVNVKPESVSAQASASCPLSPEANPEPTSGLQGTPNKFVNSEVKNEFDSEMLNLRRSPRGLKGGDKNHNQANGVGDNSKNGTLSSGGKEAKLVIHDFDRDKQNWKFQQGQIWALRRSKSGNLGCYAQIKDIESSPLRFHVDLLESCTQYKNVTRPDACGLFKASTGRREILSHDAFLYLVKAEVNGKNRFNIYPKEKEIWVLYNKQDVKYTSSDLDTGECDIVEVLENDGQSIKVLPLSSVPGYKSVFRALETQNSKRVLEVPRAEFNRFFYRVPAFLLTEEQDGRLRGSWELDLAEVPGLLPS